MQYRNAGRTRLKVSLISLGSLEFGRKLDETESIRIVALLPPKAFPGYKLDDLFYVLKDEPVKSFNNLRQGAEPVKVVGM